MATTIVRDPMKLIEWFEETKRRYCEYFPIVTQYRIANYRV